MNKHKKFKNRRSRSASLVDEHIESLDELTAIMILLRFNLTNRFKSEPSEDLEKILNRLELCMSDIIATRRHIANTRSFDQRKLNQIADEIAKIYAIHEAFNVTHKSNS